MVITIIALVIALLGVLLFVKGMLRLRRGRLIAAGAHGVFGATLIAIGTLVLAVSINLYTYSRLTLERDVATLEFTKHGDEQYKATLVESGSDLVHSYMLRGDEWQIDARILKWRGVGNLLGLDASYRLERLSGRYQNVAREQSETRTVYGLNENLGLDVWVLAQRAERWLPLADATYGSATYLPMADGAEYYVTVSQTGLVARPANEAARDATNNWD